LRRAAYAPAVIRSARPPLSVKRSRGCVWMSPRAMGRCVVMPARAVAAEAWTATEADLGRVRRRILDALAEAAYRRRQPTARRCRATRHCRATAALRRIRGLPPSDALSR
jgi:hypothetical protein